VAQNQRKGNVAKKSGGNTVFYTVLGVIALAGRDRHRLRNAGWRRERLGGHGARGPRGVPTPGPSTTRPRPSGSDAPTPREDHRVRRLPVPGVRDLLPPGPAGHRGPVRHRRDRSSSPTTTSPWSASTTTPSSPPAPRAAPATRSWRPPVAPGVPGEVNAAYWVYHDKLFEEQGSWAYKLGPRPERLRGVRRRGGPR
jgi:hypothetical protein